MSPNERTVLTLCEDASLEEEVENVWSRHVPVNLGKRYPK